MSTQVELKDEGVLKDAISDVRSDASPTNWMLAAHWEGNPNIIFYKAKGTGGADEMAGSLEDGEVMYGLEIYPVDSVIQLLNHWDLDSIRIISYPFLFNYVKEHNFYSGKQQQRRARCSVVALLIVTHGCKPGRTNKVLDVTDAAQRQDRGFTSSSNVIKTGKVVSSFQTPGSVAVNIDDAVYGAIADVRSDDTSTNWCVGSYADNNPKKPIDLIGKGADGLQGIVTQLKNDIVAYALLRVQDVVDGITTVKFVFITWVGENVKPMTKGKISTHKATIEKAFHPAHVTIYANALGELSEDIVMSKVQNASGSKSHVK
ncbi:unnamed protein product [Porites evermanni]|uniref:ADF-H domain-containing protein n=1 Tax=Porites evermanni TaxID=104178 RepID=A0ABN8QUM7_9CNID|nr:unnamed protein product [Porites evermanni]